MGFEPAISTGERTHTYVLDRAAIGTGRPQFIKWKFEIQHSNILYQKGITAYLVDSHAHSSHARTHTHTHTHTHTYIYIYIYIYIYDYK